MIINKFNFRIEREVNALRADAVREARSWETYIYIPESVDQTLKVDTGSPLGEVVRGGESERGRGGTSLEEGPQIVAFHFAPFWLPFRRSKIVLKKQYQK